MSPSEFGDHMMAANQQQNLSGPIASGDFTNIATNNAADGVYTIGGVPCAIGDIIDLDHDEVNFDPILDIDAGGIKCRDMGGGAFQTRQIPINTPLLTTLLADGFSLLMDFLADDTVSLGVSVHDNAFNMDAGGTSTNDPLGPTTRTSVTDKDFNQIDDTVHYPVLSQLNKFAMTVAADRVSASVNGAAAVTVAGPGLDALMANLVMSFAGSEGGRLRSFAFYEVVDDADLPSLSAL